MNTVHSFYGKKNIDINCIEPENNEEIYGIRQMQLYDEYSSKVMVEKSHYEEELRVIKSNLNHDIDAIILLIKITYKKEETYCERQRILGRIMILATMDKFHYPIDEINSYIDNIESIIIDSKRISESDKQNYLTNLPDKYIEHTDKKGCYVATAVYGSYDCPEVWTLRRFRDEFLNKRRLGRLLVKIYYKISPRLILTFGSIKLIKNINRKILDKIVRKLNGRGYVNSKYIDQ